MTKQGSYFNVPTKKAFRFTQDLISMKAEYINPFLSATKNVLETMAQTPVTAMRPRLKDDSATYGEVTGIIGMVSKQVSGSMIVSFSQECILKIVANMLMEPPKEKIDAEIIDAVGELTNMICGGAKAQLAKMNLRFELAAPTMIMGKGVEITYYSDTPTLVIPFRTDSGDFVIEANLADKK
ncbi:MAG: chemotaxis protein CheX [Deltaproteobacteria bacterium]